MSLAGGYAPDSVVVDVGPSSGRLSENYFLNIRRSAIGLEISTSVCSMMVIII